jgi:hypothetical protein
MSSVQTMRWILVAMTAVAAVVAFSLGYAVPGVILLLGVVAHCAHYLLHRRARPAAGPAD